MVYGKLSFHLQVQGKVYPECGIQTRCGQCASTTFYRMKDTSYGPFWVSQPPKLFERGDNNSIT